MSKSTSIDARYMFPIYVDTTKRASQIAQEQTNSNKLHKYVYSLVDLTDSGILEIFSNISRSQFRPDLYKRDARRSSSRAIIIRARYEWFEYNKTWNISRFPFSSLSYLLKIVRPTTFIHNEISACVRSLTLTGWLNFHTRWYFTFTAG